MTIQQMHFHYKNSHLTIRKMFPLHFHCRPSLHFIFGSLYLSLFTSYRLSTSNLFVSTFYLIQTCFNLCVSFTQFSVNDTSQNLVFNILCHQIKLMKFTMGPVSDAFAQLVCTYSFMHPICNTRSVFFIVFMK